MYFFGTEHYHSIQALTAADGSTSLWLHLWLFHLPGFIPHPEAALTAL